MGFDLLVPDHCLSFNFTVCTDLSVPILKYSRFAIRAQLFKASLA